MARIRTIKPSFWKHEELSALPEATHMLAAALLNYADDYGYFNANPKLIQAECCPLREPSVTIPESLRSLSGIAWLQLGTGSDGKRYGRILKFEEHQRVSHPADPKISKMTIAWDESGSAPESSRATPEPLRPEGNKEEEGNKEGNGELSLASENVSRETITDEFDRWYQTYPRRTGRAHALKAYKTARRKADAVTLLTGAERYRDDPNRNPNFTKYPSSWLNGECWADEPHGGEPQRLNGAASAPGRSNAAQSDDGLSPTVRAIMENRAAKGAA